MKRQLIFATALSLVMGAVPWIGPAAPAFAQSASDIDPRAMDALDRMGAYLASLKSFKLVAKTEIDEVMESGQKLQFSGETTYKVRRPDGFMIQMVSDRKVRQLYYDGKTLTVTAPRMGMYAQVDAPPTIREVLARAEERYDIDTPLADLFSWGTERASRDAVQGAMVVGYANLNGVDTDHYAFRGPQADWQIWIQRGDQPLPLKIVITSWQEDDSPQYSAELQWTLSETFAADTFTFTPPDSAMKIDLADVGAEK